jgi:NAD(P)-dependent dehydrogenase (short-subunit alcohol dehydrogenase family)
VLLKIQSALVTGGSSGIGAAVVQALAAAGGEVFTIQADTSDERAIDAMIATAVQRLGRLDVLLFNSGMQKDMPFQDFSLEEWRRVIDVPRRDQPLAQLMRNIPA